MGCLGALAYTYMCVLLWRVQKEEGDEIDEMGLAGSGLSLRNEGPGTDWPCLDGPDSDVLRSAIAVSGY